MTQRPTIPIALTKEQQLEVLAATGLLVRTVEVDLAVRSESGEVTAELPPPEWFTQVPAGR
jgi:hypothetical protein